MTSEMWIIKLRGTGWALLKECISFPYDGSKVSTVNCIQMQWKWQVTIVE